MRCLLLIAIVLAGCQQKPGGTIYFTPEQQGGAEPQINQSVQSSYRVPDEETARALAEAFAKNWGKSSSATIDHRAWVVFFPTPIGEMNVIGVRKVVIDSVTGKCQWSERNEYVPD